MQPKISEGQDKSRVTAEAKALLETGWIFDDEDMGVKKTYNFKTYTKALVNGAYPQLRERKLTRCRTFSTP